MVISCSTEENLVSAGVSPCKSDLLLSVQRLWRANSSINLPGREVFVFIYHLIVKVSGVNWWKARQGLSPLETSVALPARDRSQGPEHDKEHEDPPAEKESEVSVEQQDEGQDRHSPTSSLQQTRSKGSPPHTVPWLALSNQTVMEPSSS